MSKRKLDAVFWSRFRDVADLIQVYRDTWAIEQLAWVDEDIDAGEKGFRLFWRWSSFIDPETAEKVVVLHPGNLYDQAKVQKLRDKGWRVQRSSPVSPLVVSKELPWPRMVDILDAMEQTLAAWYSEQTPSYS